jgi:hypothetical protein
MVLIKLYPPLHVFSYSVFSKCTATAYKMFMKLTAGFSVNLACYKHFTSVNYVHSIISYCIQTMSALAYLTAIVNYSCKIFTSLTKGPRMKITPSFKILNFFQNFSQTQIKMSGQYYKTLFQIIYIFEQ